MLFLLSLIPSARLSSPVSRDPSKEPGFLLVKKEKCQDKIGCKHHSGSGIESILSAMEELQLQEPGTRRKDPEPPGTGLQEFGAPELLKWNGGRAGGQINDPESCIKPFFEKIRRSSLRLWQVLTSREWMQSEQELPED